MLDLTCLIKQRHNEIVFSGAALKTKFTQGKLTLT